MVKKSSTSSSNPSRVAAKGGQRTKSTIMRLKMYKSGGAIRNKEGKVVGGSLMMSTKSGGTTNASTTARIAPNRRYFANTRTTAQNSGGDLTTGTSWGDLGTSWGDLRPT